MSATDGLVYIVDDDPAFRNSLVGLLDASGFETLAFENASTFRAQTSFTHPACLLLDVDLPDLDGIRLQQKLITQNSHIPIIFITGRGDIPMSVKAMKAGALDFLTKPIATDELLETIIEALSLDSHAVEEEARKEKIHSLMNTLTTREMEILRWVIAGKLNKEIAYALNIAEKTVKIHRGHVMEKLQVSSVAELVRLAEQANISPVECVTD